MEAGVVVKEMAEKAVPKHVQQRQHRRRPEYLFFQPENGKFNRSFSQKYQNSIQFYLIWLISMKKSFAGVVHKKRIRK